MAPNAWRCSQCGTVNEPGSRSCSECGRWPSLFDLQDSVVDEERPELLEVDPVAEPEAFEPDAFEPDAFEPEPMAEPAAAPVARPTADEQPTRRLLIFLTIVVVNLLSNRG
jgi:hypothetical protein